ncbi:GNAT family N-acetyltransferase [Romboutsia weinsteinii]|uniref:GNAT family N-acetyltransferase n=1 Tax=Romboutsia weinsteinii TaxID=2020949 RepID=A0A255I5W5_9FIRM|nr:N-acetyltransferase [Romboutsia weinsteinii]RDY26299.1 GNAT family N-acetyltransferase [Romboutsia weinsteinii]
MDIVEVDLKNIDKEHICCALSDKKGESQVSSKKEWLKERFNDGLVFKKGNVRGKVFIEYMPAENAWCPIIADDYMFINCLWVSGKYKGQGISDRLLEECIIDSKEKCKKGLVILSSDKKRPYLSDPKYLEYKGFKLADTSEPYYKLYYFPFENNIIIPEFKNTVKKDKDNELGFTLYYSNQCPFTSKYVKMAENFAIDRNVDLHIVRYENKEQAQSSSKPFTTYSLYHDGEFVTHEILNEKKFEDIFILKKFIKNRV